MSGRNKHFETIRRERGEEETGLPVCDRGLGHHHWWPREAPREGVTSGPRPGREIGHHGDFWRRAYRGGEGRCTGSEGNNKEACVRRGGHLGPEGRGLRSCKNLRVSCKQVGRLPGTAMPRGTLIRVAF